MAHTKCANASNISTSGDWTYRWTGYRQGSISSALIIFF